MNNDQNLRQVLQMTSEMLTLADTGDHSRSDYGCGIIYGTLRDTAYKIRKMVEKELESHVEMESSSDSNQDTYRGR